jgi:hypothetical protein
MNSLSCPRCRSLHAAGESFCTNCGAALHATASGASAPATSGRVPPVDRPCSRCGELNPVTEAFCSRCGVPTQPGRPTPEPQPVSAPSSAGGASRGLLWGIVAACFGILVLFFVLHASKAKEERQMEAALRQWNGPAPVQTPPIPMQPMPPPAPVQPIQQPTARQVACPSCGGTGKCSNCATPLARAMGGGPGKCSVCHGTGKENIKNALGYYEDCSACRGTARCSRCGGTGECQICGGSGLVTPEVAQSLQELDRDLRRYQPPIR